MDTLLIPFDLVCALALIGFGAGLICGLCCTGKPRLPSRAYFLHDEQPNAVPYWGEWRPEHGEALRNAARRQ